MFTLPVAKVVSDSNRWLSRSPWHPFVVERGSPGDGLGGLWLLLGGSVALVLGVPAAMRWRTGTLNPREISP